MCGGRCTCVCVWGGLASGQIYDSYQGSVFLNEMFIWNFLQNGVRGLSPVTAKLHVKPWGGGYHWGDYLLCPVWVQCVNIYWLCQPYKVS